MLGMAEAASGVGRANYRPTGQPDDWLRGIRRVHVGGVGSWVWNVGGDHRLGRDVSAGRRCVVWRAGLGNRKRANAQGYDARQPEKLGPSVVGFVSVAADEKLPSESDRHEDGRSKRGASELLHQRVGA